MKPQEKQNRGGGGNKKPKNQKKTLKICGDRETVHLREEDLTRTASLEVGKARERGGGGGGGGRPRRRTRPNSARNCSPERHKERKKERVHKSAKNTQNFQTEKHGVNYIQKQLQ